MWNEKYNGQCESPKAKDLFRYIECYISIIDTSEQVIKPEPNRVITRADNVTAIV